MSITQIGSRLVRDIGKGNELKTIVTETVGNKTFTKVLNSAGDLIQSRVKLNTMEEVGDKLVRTTTKIIESNRGAIDKSIVDRVYASGKFAGARGQYFHLYDGKFIKDEKWLQSSDSDQRYIKNIYKNLTYTKQSGTAPSGSSEQIKTFREFIGYNNRGLPMSQKYHGDILNDMSLTEMRNVHYENFPHIKYVPDALNMPALNQTGKEIGHLNNLDRLL